MTDPAALVAAIIGSVDEKSVESLLRVFGRRILPGIVSDIAHSLGSPRQDHRLLALARLLLNICYGADTERGALLSAAVLSYLKENWPSLVFEYQHHLDYLCVSALTACIHAHYEEGRWDECETLLANADGLPGLKVLDEHWSAPALVARIRIARNDIRGAQQLLDQVPANVNERAPQVSLTRDLLSAFRGKRFELHERLATQTQARAIWHDAFSRNISILNQLSSSLIGQPTQQVISFGADELRPLQLRLEEMRALAASDTPFEKKYAQLALLNQEWREALFLLLNPGADRNRPTTEWVRRVFDRGSYLVATREDSETDVERCLAELSTAGEWSQRCGDWHSVWMSAWTRLLIAEYRDRIDDAIVALRQLVTSLDERRLAASDPEVRGNIANFLPGLAAKSIKLNDCCENVELLFAACELRKARSLVASQAHETLGEQIRPLACGPGTHYLAYTVIHASRRIQAFLLMANGKLQTFRLPVEIATIEKFATRLQPELHRGYGVEADRRSLAEALHALVEPLQAALETGDIAAGDHICIAAEDPINLIPLHNLIVGGRPAGLHFSMSRVTSFADARHLAREAALAPAHSVAIHVPTRSKAAAEFRTYFDRAARELRSALPGEVFAPQSPMTAADVMGKLRENAVIHVHAHGWFRQLSNPLTCSGIVVSDGRGLPALDGDPERLLTPAHVLEGRPGLKGSHVTLCACVSGLGLEGSGGDILGMEMALRLNGASSVLATHWQVRSEVASEFTREFYRNWLVERLPRGVSWRKAIEACWSAPSPELAAESFAFSLFGGWH